VAMRCILWLSDTNHGWLTLVGFDGGLSLLLLAVKAKKIEREDARCIPHLIYVPFPHPHPTLTVSEI
jgi:hypothetical protein